LRLESALEIIGALKRRFGERMTVSDVCRAVSLSYQPVYATVQALAAEGALTLEKEGQRVHCRPAAGPAGSLWLAHWSLVELRRERSRALAELMSAVESRISADPAVAGAIVAVDPGSGLTIHTEDGGFPTGGSRARVRRVQRGEWGGILRGEAGDWSVARRIIPVCGQQLLWQIALAERDQVTVERAVPPPIVRRREFVD